MNSKLKDAFAIVIGSATVVWLFAVAVAMSILAIDIVRDWSDPVAHYQGWSCRKSHCPKLVIQEPRVLQFDGTERMDLK